METGKINSYKNNAKIAGILLIIGTVAGILSVVFTGSVLGAPDYLSQLSANENQVVTGAFFELVMAFACASIAIALYPVLKKYNEGLALWLIVKGFNLSAIASGPAMPERMMSKPESRRLG